LVVPPLIHHSSSKARQWSTAADDQAAYEARASRCARDRHFVWELPREGRKSVLGYSTEAKLAWARLPSERAAETTPAAPAITAKTKAVTEKA
jgi:hypothetical protein